MQIALYLAAAGLLIRLIQIQVFDHKKYAAMAKEQYTREYTQRAPRGIIYDRNYTTLALNKERFDLGVYKRAVSDFHALCSKLAGIIDVSESGLRRKLKKEGSYVVLQRDIDREDAHVIGMLNLPGVKVTTASERLYPFKETLSQVIGFADVDGNGLSGIELEFNDRLKGADGWSILQKDALGKSVMPIASLTRESRKGDDVVLTIDHSIQNIAEQELKQTVSRHNAKGGVVIITNPGSGEILAMAAAPGFDANVAGTTNPDAWRIRAITDIFEPGSTLKIVTMMLALQDTAFTQDDIIFCENGSYSLFGETINDPEKHGWLTLENIFKHSSNIGTAKIALQLGKERLYRGARDFGLGNKTGVELPGEVSGILKRTSDWSKFTTAALSYGHEVAVTALQLAMAYGAIANGGLLMKPTVVKEILGPNGNRLYQSAPQVIRKVMDPVIAGKMTHILEQVVLDGTGQQARIPNVRLAGKTGTAQKPKHGPGGYSNSAFVASFVGFYPTEQARYLIYVAIDEPYPVHSGGSVAAPAVKRILERIIQVYETPQPVPAPRMTSLSPDARQNIPDLVGRAVEFATKILEELGVEYKISGQGKYIKGQTIMTEDGKVQIQLALETINENIEFSSMPGLIGLTVRNAIAELSRHGLRAKIIGSGLVTGQQPEAGSKMRVGSRCYLECKPVVSVNLLAN